MIYYCKHCGEAMYCQSDIPPDWHFECAHDPRVASKPFVYEGKKFRLRDRTDLERVDWHVSDRTSETFIAVPYMASARSKNGRWTRATRWVKYCPSDGPCAGERRKWPVCRESDFHELFEEVPPFEELNDCCKQVRDAIDAHAGMSEAVRSFALGDSPFKSLHVDKDDYPQWARATEWKLQDQSPLRRKITEVLRKNSEMLEKRGLKDWHSISLGKPIRVRSMQGWPVLFIKTIFNDADLTMTGTHNVGREFRSTLAKLDASFELREVDDD